MALLSARIFDDSGALVPLRSDEAEPDLSESPAALEELRALRGVVEDKDMDELRGVAWHSAVMTGGGGTGWVLGMPSGNGLLATVLFFAVSVLFLMVWRATRWPRQRRREADAYLGASRCPACYSELTPGAGSPMTVCGACGARWETLRVGCDVGREAHPTGEARVDGLPRTRDAEGRWRRVFTGDVLRPGWEGARADEDEAERRIRCSQALERARLRVFCVVYGALITLLVVGFGLHACGSTLRQGLPVAVILVMIACVVGGLLGMYLVYRKPELVDRRLGRVRGRVLVSHGLCACCGRDLGSGERVDGLVVCLCGASWEVGVRGAGSAHGG